MTTDDYWKSQALPLTDKVFKEAKFPNIKEAPVYNIPYRAKVLEIPDGEKVKVSIPCARRNWWIIFPLFLFLVCPPILAHGFVSSFFINYRTGAVNFVPIQLGIYAVVLAVLIYVLHIFCFPRVTIEGTRAGITIGGYRFDWQKTKGLRLGYSAGGKPVEEVQFRWHGLRMSYGAWGFDLPYMPPSYQAASYVVWINMMLETVGQEDPETAINNPEEGFLKELY